MTDDHRIIKRLTRDEFADALRKGLGRALLHVLRYGLDDVADLVLEACLHDQMDDIISHANQAAWLVRMFCDSPRYSEFSEAIWSQLKFGKEEVDMWRVCALVKEMAARGDAAARKELGEYVREQARIPFGEDPVGAEEWVDLEGWEALLELAQIYGRRVLLELQDEVPDDLLRTKYPEQQAKERLFQHAQTDPNIKAYWDYLAAKGLFDPPTARVQRETYRERIRKEFTSESILEDARNKVGEYPGPYSRFGDYATADELKEIYAHLVNETDEAVQLRLLWVFWRAPLPELNEMILRWAEGTPGTNEMLMRSAIAALVHTTDERVHALARSKVRAAQLAGPDSHALRLFLNNYDQDDAYLIAQALSSLNPDRDDAHSLEGDLADLAEKVRDVALTDALTWAYENSPCPICRLGIVEGLGVVDRLDDAVRYECEFDCEELTRKFAKSLPIIGFHPTKEGSFGKLRDWNN